MFKYSKKTKPNTSIPPSKEKKTQSHKLLIEIGTFLLTRSFLSISLEVTHNLYESCKTEKHFERLHNFD